MTTQLERQETLLLLASLQAGQNVMDPEPKHLEAIFELLEEDEPMMYPQEHYVVPADEQARIDRERRERHERLFPLAKRGPEEREYRPVPFWFTCLVLATFNAVIATVLWFVGRVEGTEAVVAAIVCTAALCLVWGLIYAASKDEPKKRDA